MFKFIVPDTGKGRRGAGLKSKYPVRKLRTSMHHKVLWKVFRSGEKHGDTALEYTAEEISIPYGKCIVFVRKLRTF